MRLIVLSALFIISSTLQAGLFSSDEPKVRCVYSGTDGNCVEPIVRSNNELVITVVGQGVAPSVTASPAQAYALAKRAAMIDGYKLIAEKVRGVNIDGKDSVKNLMLINSSTRTSVEALVRGANITNTTFKEGLCEVEMEVVLSYSQFR